MILSTVRAPIERALEYNAPPLKNMLIFSFYFIFKLKFHQKKGLEIIQDARSNGAPTVHILLLVQPDFGTRLVFISINFHYIYE